MRRRIRWGRGWGSMWDAVGSSCCKSSRANKDRAGISLRAASGLGDQSRQVRSLTKAVVRDFGRHGLSGHAGSRGRNPAAANLIRPRAIFWNASRL